MRLRPLGMLLTAAAATACGVSFEGNEPASSSGGAGQGGATTSAGGPPASGGGAAGGEDGAGGEGAMAAGGSGGAASCTTSLPDSGTFFDEASGRCYLWHRPAGQAPDTTRDDAKSYCATWQDDATLVALSTQAEIDAVEQGLAAADKAFDWFWISGTDEAREGSWVWANGEPWAVTAWSAGEPMSEVGGSDADCLIRSFEGWRTRPCFYNHYPLCERAP